MKCPNCGEEIKDGYLYCEHCGKDIHIVPDYEPELELSLMQSVGEILNEEIKERELKQERILAHKRNMQKVIKCLALAGGVCLAVVLCIFIINLIKDANFNSYEYQLNKAYACRSEGKYDSAVSFYERALELNPKDAGARLDLAELYCQLGYDKLYMEQLETVAFASYASSVEVEKAYNKMIDVYVAKEEYATIYELLQNCSKKAVINENRKYLSNPPEFSYAEGTYAEIIPLKISSENTGTIYYTTDGSKPDENSEKYVAPIFLETGAHVISALFVNEYGISSDIVTKEYVIEVSKPSAPEVAVYSGEYFVPTSIVVDILEGCRVFYTTDGSYPTDQSAEYVGPIPMPLGKSYFKFIAYNKEGVFGEITNREYKLTIDTEVTVDEACQAVIDVMLQNGKIFNSLGESYQVAGKYLYIFQYPLAVPDKGYYYVITEVYEDPDGLQTETGEKYAVNIYDETVYKFTNNNGNYLLEGF